MADTRLRLKRNIYTLCFAALSALDFVRNTQNGDIWGTAVNVSGLVMLVIIASAWPLRELLTLPAAVWTLACAALCVYAPVSIRSTGMDVFCGMYIWTFVTAVANVWWITLFLARLLKRLRREGKPLRKPGKLACMWVLMSVLMVCSRSGRIWPVWFLAMFGIFYLTPYDRQDSRALAGGLIDGTILGFFGLQIFAYGFRPYDVVRYVGAFANSNMAALHYLIVYAALLMKLHELQQQGASRWWKLFYLTGACGMLGFMFMTMGRTSWGIAILLTLVYGILVMRRIWRQKWGQIVARGAALTLGMVLLFPAVFGTARWLPTILHHPVWFLDEYSINKVHSFDPPDSWKYVEMDEFLDVVFGRIWRTFQAGVKDPLVLVAEAAQQDDSSPEELEIAGSENMDTSLRIRLSIYKAYFQNLNMLGHGPSEGMFQFKDQPYHAWHAQNLWLEVAYRYGIPTGLLFIITTVWLLVRHIRRMRSANGLSRAIIPLLVCIVFFGYGTMEVVWNLGQYILILFFVVQHPLFYQEPFYQES